MDKLTTNELPLNEFRRQVGEWVNQTYYANKAFVLLKGDRRVAALLPIALLDRLVELEAFYAQTIEKSQEQELSQLQATPSEAVDEGAIVAVQEKPEVDALA